MSLEVEVYSRLLSNMSKVNFRMTWTVSKWTKYLGMKLMDLIYIPEDLDEIKLLLPSLWSKCVASRYDQAQNMCFNPLIIGPHDMKQAFKRKILQ